MDWILSVALLLAAGAGFAKKEKVTYPEQEYRGILLDVGVGHLATNNADTSTIAYQVQIDDLVYTTICYMLPSDNCSTNFIINDPVTIKTLADVPPLTHGLADRTFFLVSPDGKLSRLDVQRITRVRK